MQSARRKDDAAAEGGMEDDMNVALQRWPTPWA